ncbi:MAG: hypothetical protein R3174_05870 [Gammaproteobacteria bacterium]|nr:hypothetical protein [Gammaproteobacteria bacterium]
MATVRPSAIPSLCELFLAVALSAGPVTAETAPADFDAAAEAISRGDVQLGIDRFEKLALNGDARAQDALATIYLKGLGVERDVNAAMSWYCMLAHHPEGGLGIMQAVWFLAEWFRTGGGLPGRHYNDGNRASEDPIRAYFWFSVMAAQEKLFNEVHQDSVRLGKIGMTAVGSALYEEEIAALRVAVEKWRPDRPAESPQQCLEIPASVVPRTD